MCAFLFCAHSKRKRHHTTSLAHGIQTGSSCFGNQQGWRMLASAIQIHHLMVDKTFNQQDMKRESIENTKTSMSVLVGSHHTHSSQANIQIKNLPTVSRLRSWYALVYRYNHGLSNIEFTHSDFRCY